MTMHVIDNSLKNLGKSVLWQYDRAVRLLSLMKHMQVLFHCAIEQFWDNWRLRILSIDKCGTFGCYVWGLLLGVPRPIVTDSDGEQHYIAIPVYRRLLKGAFFLMKAKSTFDDMLAYLEIVFGVDGTDTLSKWTAYVSEYGWTTNVDELNEATDTVAKYYPRLAYEAKTVFIDDATGKRWLCSRPITAKENTSLETLQELDAIEQTTDAPTIISSAETVLLKLKDPEGIVRKIGGGPKDALSISVEYVFGETPITATIMRHQKCGIYLKDNEDLSMEYGKSQYYDDMHRDQKALFEQQFEEICPFPLGIRTNDVVGQVVLGFIGQSNVQYESGKGYGKGDIFWYPINDPNGHNWVCTEDISIAANSSFEKIADKVKPTNDGGPFIGGLSEPDISYVSLLDYDKPLPPIYMETYTINPYELFLGYDGDMLKCYKNTETSLSVPLGETGKQVCIWLGEQAKARGCHNIPSNYVHDFLPNTFYRAGKVVHIDGAQRTLLKSMVYGSAQEVMDNSLNNRGSGIHKWYPFENFDS